MSLGGLEKIAADFQEGRTPIIICNKKAEVGINLHRGTTDIHHLTLPWTPASVAQRNGPRCPSWLQPCKRFAFITTAARVLSMNTD
ncbi:hypothetical protein BWI86_27500 (plasmid) [Escherichia coli]|nr:hypothetical protein BWI86_27500 [Escherichia coli]